METPLHHLARNATLYKRFHPLLGRRPRVDTMAFNKQNQIPIDVAYDDLRWDPSSDSEVTSNFHPITEN